MRTTPESRVVAVYGDFNCPFSALASGRVARLEQHGGFRIEWRAVEHNPEIPRAGTPAIGEIAEELDRELEQVRTLLLDDERLVLYRPAVRSNTHSAIGRYAATGWARCAAVRAELFESYWVRGQDLGDEQYLDSAVGSETRGDVAQRWRDEWLEVPRPIVPLMRFEDGGVSRGLGTLARLADMLIAQRS